MWWKAFCGSVEREVKIIKGITCFILLYRITRKEVGALSKGGALVLRNRCQAIMFFMEYLSWWRAFEKQRSLKSLNTTNNTNNDTQSHSTHSTRGYQPKCGYPHYQQHQVISLSESFGCREPATTRENVTEYEYFYIQVK